jgi:hypothetical protein
MITTFPKVEFLGIAYKLAFMKTTTPMISWLEPKSALINILPKISAKRAIKSILKHTDDKHMFELLFDSLLLQTLSTETKTNANTIFNTKQLHDASAAIHMSRVGSSVLVSGATGRPLDLCIVVCVKRSTVDVQLMRTPLPFEKRNFSVDFYSVSPLPTTKFKPS